MHNANCHMTRVVYFLFVPWDDDDNCIKAPKRKTSKMLKIWQRILVHIIFKVFSINIWIQNESVLLSVDIMSKHVDGNNSDRWDNYMFPHIYWYWHNLLIISRGY